MTLDLANFPSSEVDKDSRGPTVGLWDLLRVEEAMIDPSTGWELFDDFLWVPTGRYVETQATTGSFAILNEDGGWVRVASGSSTANQGINVQLTSKGGSNATEIIKAEDDTLIGFEAKIRPDNLEDQNFFVGLSENDATIMASGANTSANHIGFEIASADTNSVAFVSEKAGARKSIADVVTLANDTVVKLGFIVRHTGLVEIYVDGVKHGTDVEDTANIPTTEMAPSFVAQSRGTASVQFLFDMDWWRLAKIYRRTPGSFAV